MSRIALSQKQKWLAYAPNLAVLLGIMVYLVQAVLFAHTTPSSLDEGAYLLKGILFATGKYQPFEAGISTNKAPLAFLIPGYVQLLFGAGLRTGRYLAVFFGVMAVAGTWVASRRIGNKWLAAGTVWVFALSPALIKLYSLGVTQSTIACLFAWMLVFSLGENRPLWQLMLAGLLAGLMIMVRQNMVPVLPLLALYAFWEHGWKAFALLIFGMAVMVLLHIPYLPSILQLWGWVPYIQLPAQATYSGGGIPSWNPDISLISRVLSIFQAIRLHFVAVVGSIVSFLLWPKLNSWRKRSDFRMGAFLLALFWGLIIMHSLAAIGQDYCVFCFTSYIAFFNIAGILLLVLLAKSWNWRPSKIRQALLIVVFLIIFTGVGFSAFEDIGIRLLNLPAPRMRDLRILPGLVTWWDILSNKFHLNINEAKKYVSAFWGFATGSFIISAGFLIWRRMWRDKAGLGAFIATLILVMALFLSPVLHGSSGKLDCNSDVILANEKIGEYLRGIIPRDSLVYWNGGLSAVPLLYLPDVDIFPPQINSGYSFRSNGNTAELIEFGFWNEEMDAEWRATADFFIIESERYNEWKKFFNPDQFVEFVRSPIGTSCLKESQLRIFHRK
ncbi:MAG: glycosyltransferase family 39 protein [Chloroflexi bacterium]|nr:glycosyltransferase family 39 protein [Chloroflexota bacterium]